MIKSPCLNYNEFFFFGTRVPFSFCLVLSVRSTVFLLFLLCLLDVFSGSDLRTKEKKGLIFLIFLLFFLVLVLTDVFYSVIFPRG